jgi:hypothetical protein
MTVALGPSLAYQTDALQATLGTDYHVVGFLDEPWPDGSGSGDIAILSTPELPDGQVLVQEHGPHGVIVVGMNPPRARSASPAPLPADVLAAIRSLSARIHPVGDTGSASLAL